MWLCHLREMESASPSLSAVAADLSGPVIAYNFSPMAALEVKGAVHYQYTLLFVLVLPQYHTTTRISE